MNQRRTFLKASALATGSLLIPSQSLRAATSPPTPFSLPDLDFPLAALEPYIDEKTMGIHHGLHHAAYLKKLNEALTTTPTLHGKPIEAILSSLPTIADPPTITTIRNNGGGHWNHSFFWKTLTPSEKSGTPSPALLTAINTSFGSIETLKLEFEKTALSRFGSGWAWLILQDGKLKITSTANQDNPLMSGLLTPPELGTPILGLDIWEHAYYLKYQNKRADYISAFWNIIHWENVSARLPS